MKGEDIYEALTGIDEKFILDAAPGSGKIFKKKRARLLRVTAAAAILALLAVGLTVGGFFSAKKFKKIVFGQTLDGFVFYIDENTTVTGITDYGQFPTQLPIYKISPKDISKKDFNAFLDLLDVGNKRDQFKLKENGIEGFLTSWLDSEKGITEDGKKEIYEKTEQTFLKIPFAYDDYVFPGGTSTTRRGDVNGEKIVGIGVSFLKKLDGFAIKGCEFMDFEYTGDGFSGTVIQLYDYKEIGTMDLIPVEEAAERIKSPDWFDVDEIGLEKEMQKIVTLEVRNVSLYWVNQYSEDRDVLQPVYRFDGIATDINGTKAPFRSIVYAVPDSYVR